MPLTLERRDELQIRISDTLYEYPLALIRHLAYWNEDWRGCIDTLENTSPRDWQGNQTRVIHESDIENVLREELESDPYILGCFNAQFITKHSNLPLKIVETLQSAEKFEALGQHLIDADCVRDMAQGYACADGYGHHFNHYDGSEERLGAWYVFRIN